MVGPYRSGINLGFYVDQNRWALILQNPAWSLQNGQTYPVSFAIDSTGDYTASAVAIVSDMVEIILPDSVELFNRFRWGNVLVITTVSQNLSFNLTNTSASLAALGQCYASRGNIASSNPFAAVSPQSNPFAPQPAASNTGSGQDLAMADRAEATTLAANLLGAAGTTNFRILTAEETPKGLNEWAAVWVAGQTVGVLGIDRPGASVTEEAAAGYIIGSDGAACKGKFASGFMPDDTNSSGNLKRLFTSCQDNKPWTAYYLMFPRPKDGYYVIGTITTAEPTQAQKADSDIRAAVYSTFKQ
jgi:hypothetical protein